MSLFLCLSGNSLGDIVEKVLPKEGGFKKRKKKGGGNIGELPKKGGSNLLHTMLLMFSTIVSLYLCMFYAHQN